MGYASCRPTEEDRRQAGAASAESDKGRHPAATVHRRRPHQLQSLTLDEVQPKVGTSIGTPLSSIRPGMLHQSDQMRKTDKGDRVGAAIST